MLCLPVLVAVIAGCSTAQGYDAVRALGEAKAECDRRLTEADRRACEAAYQRDYDEYRAERAEIQSD